jgi:shikimate dehydrogenase
MFNAAFSALGLNAVYIALDTPPAALPHVLRSFEAVGIAGNVTIPHKVQAAELLIRTTELAGELDAVNTFWPDGDRLIGDNTDVAGVLDALATLEAEGPWLVAGTGGSARAVAAAARSAGTQLLVQSRRPQRATDFVQWATNLDIDAHVDDGRPVATLINATPLGLEADDPLPFAHERMQGCRTALDLVYARGETPWCREMRSHGTRAGDGRLVLVGQGTRAFLRFFPNAQPPRAIMAAAVERALAP